MSHNELATFLKTAEALRVRGLAEDEKKRVSGGVLVSVNSVWLSGSGQARLIGQSYVIIAGK